MPLIAAAIPAIGSLLGGLLGGGSTPATATSGVTAGISTDFVNNAELVLGSPDAEISGGGVTGSNPSVTGSVSPGSTDLGGAVDDASSSGMSAIMWISAAGIVVAVILAMKD